MLYITCEPGRKRETLCGEHMALGLLPVAPGKLQPAGLEQSAFAGSLLVWLDTDMHAGVYFQATNAKRVKRLFILIHRCYQPLVEHISMPKARRGSADLSR